MVEKAADFSETNIAKVQSAIAHGGLQAYSTKAPSYFAGVRGARTDYLRELPNDRHARILEIGCGDGATGALALLEGKCEQYCGVELCQSAADKAKDRITEVLVGNIEDRELPWPPECFDALILSEVLEHLVDPWAVLRKIRPLMKPCARVFASSPNVSHHRVIRMLIAGEWSLADLGVMDRTHLRWFTPRAYKALFESSGYIVDSVGEVAPLSRKARVVSFLTFGRFRHLFVGQVSLKAHCP
jgi:2-polyprenyl-3-methyl-5-hydroxy-6-metoxy-1,4-benzoquinol methylase